MFYYELSYLILLLPSENFTFINFYYMDFVIPKLLLSTSTGNMNEDNIRIYKAG